MEQEQRSYLDDEQKLVSRRCSRNSQDEGALDEGHEAREMKRSSRAHSSLRTPKHSHTKLTYRNVLDSDSDQDFDSHKPRRHSFREPRGCHTPDPAYQRSPDLGRRSQRSSPKTSLANDMLMVQCGERWGVRRHSAVSVMSDTLTMVRRPSIVSTDQWPGSVVMGEQERRPSGADSRRGSERRRSSVTAPHGLYADQHNDHADNNITIVVSQDEINSNSRNGELVSVHTAKSSLLYSSCAGCIQTL